METRKYEQLLNLSNGKFRRYTGITCYVFELMAIIVKEYERQVKGNIGRANNLSVHAPQIARHIVFFVLLVNTIAPKAKVDKIQTLCIIFQK